MMIACFLEIILVPSSPHADHRRGCPCSSLVSRASKTLDGTWSDGRALRQFPLTPERSSPASRDLIIIEDRVGNDEQGACAGSRRRPACSLDLAGVSDPERQ